MKKILVIEDDVFLRRIISRKLLKEGYSVIEAIDGEKGLKTVKEEKPDLITLDITMDKESGIGMYRKLKENAETADIPVVMITGISPEFKKFIEKRKQVPPPDAYFEKPIDKDKLLQTVQELID